MNSPARPDYSLAKLLEYLLPGTTGDTQECDDDDDDDDDDDNLNARIMEVIFEHDLLSWGRKDGGTEPELIPELAWQMGKFDHRAGRLVYRHPDSPLPEEYRDIEFNRAEVEPWLQELGSAGDPGGHHDKLP